VSPADLDGEGRLSTAHATDQQRDLTHSSGA
jgi:hypothetical protein